MADECKTYRRWHDDAAASVRVWQRALLDDVDDAFSGGDLPRAQRRLVQLGEFTAAMPRRGLSGTLVHAVHRLGQERVGAAEPLDAAYRVQFSRALDTMHWRSGIAHRRIQACRDRHERSSTGNLAGPREAESTYSWS